MVTRYLKKTIADLLNRFGYRIVNIDRYYSDMEDKFWQFYNKCESHTMTSVERMYTLYKSVHYLVNNNITGAFVECGVWKGGSSRLMAETLVELEDISRDIYLFDTYEGMVKPSADIDVDYRDQPAMTRWLSGEKDEFNEWAYSPLGEVREFLYKSGYPQDSLHFVKGRVEDTLPAQEPEDIALLRLDTDWYESTAHELSYLYPKLRPGGILIIDDYGHWAGARKAVDEYFSDKPYPYMHRIDYSGRLLIKESEVQKTK